MSVQNLDLRQMIHTLCGVQGLHFNVWFNATNPEAQLIWSQYGSDFPGFTAPTYTDFTGSFTFVPENIPEHKNSYFYPFTNASGRFEDHCYTPLNLAREDPKTDAIACGYPWQASLFEHARSRGGEQYPELTYCAVPPVKPTEGYLECRYSPYECYVGAVAEGFGQVGTFCTFFSISLIILARCALGVPAPLHRTDGEVEFAITNPQHRESSATKINFAPSAF